jgi:hypothetical protein
MSTSPVSPEDIRAAAEVHHELGPEYSDAVVASFLEKVDRELAARVEARLAASAAAVPAGRESRRALVKGVVIGACAGALATTVAFGLPALHEHSPGAQRVTRVPPQIVVPFRALPQNAILTPFITFRPAHIIKRPA